MDATVDVVLLNFDATVVVDAINSFTVLVVIFYFDAVDVIVVVVDATAVVIVVLMSLLLKHTTAVVISCRKKKEREALGVNWKRRIKGMLFFDWHFPISNNKLKLQASKHRLRFCFCSHPETEQYVEHRNSFSTVLTFLGTNYLELRSVG